MVNKHTFPTFKEAIDFLENKRREGYDGIYYPEGGDKPRQFTTETPRHVVIICTLPETEVI